MDQFFFNDQAVFFPTDKEIKEGQKKALVSVCLQKYKKTFDSLDEKKQEKLKKQFPVLFQTDF